MTMRSSSAMQRLTITRLLVSVAEFAVGAFVGLMVPWTVADVANSFTVGLAVAAELALGFGLLWWHGHAEAVTAGVAAFATFAAVSMMGVALGTSGLG